MSKLRTVGRKRQLDIYQEIIQKCKDHNCKRWICGSCHILDPEKCGIIKHQQKQFSECLESGDMSAKAFWGALDKITRDYKNE